MFNRRQCSGRSICFLVSVALLAVAAHAADDPQTTAPAAPSSAQTGEASSDLSLQEVVVSARRREERLSDVPVAASVVSPIALQNAGTNIASIGMSVPSLQIAQAATGNGGSITIRGISSSSSNDALEQAVAVNIDGIAVSRGRVLDQGFFDLDNVQVLKGPQALFFGKNSPAGAITIDSKNPGNTLEGYMKAGYEYEGDEYTAEGAASIPITDDLSIRIAGRFNDMRRGYLDNEAQAIYNPLWKQYNAAPANPELPGDYGGLARFTAVYKPTDKFSATLKILVDSNHDDSESTPRQSVCAAGVTVSKTQGGLIDPFDDCRLNGTTSYGQLPPQVAAGWPQANNGVYYSRFNSVLPSLVMNYDMGKVTLTSVTGALHYYSQDMGDTSGSVYASYLGYNEEDFTSVSQEFRAVTNFDLPINFTGGFLYENTDRQYTNSGMLGSGTPADTRNGQTNVYTNNLTGNGNTYSGFGQLNWHILSDLELAGGVRYTVDQRSGTVENIFVNNNFARLSPATLLPEGTSLGAAPTSRNWSPEATLTWHMQPGLMLYGAYKTGYLSGGVSAPAIVSRIFTDQNIVFKPELAKGGEVGLKFNSSDNRLRGDVTAYTYNYTNLQVSSFSAATLSYLLSNAGEARARGIEDSIDYKVTKQLSVHAASSYNVAKYVTFQGAQCYAAQAVGTAPGDCTAGQQDLSGRPLPRAPKWSASAGASYDEAITGVWNVDVTPELHYSGAYYYDENLNPTSLQKGFITADLSGRVTSDVWEFSLIGRNLTNKYYGTFAIDKPGANDGSILAVIGRPREVVFEIERKF
jgi:iron complex outermembrane recepter protein